ncbi:hypothetical protein [uncultured Prevotella sp.]|nr:hypothetical protein [uncultured Prevotella sp.]
MSFRKRLEREFVTEGGIKERLRHITSSRKR